jgi:hypothetical protein
MQESKPSPLDQIEKNDLITAIEFKVEQYRRELKTVHSIEELRNLCLDSFRNTLLLQTGLCYLDKKIKETVRYIQSKND